MKQSFVIKGLASLTLGLGLTSSAQANCKSEEIVNGVLDAAAIVGTVNTTVNVAQAVIRPLADMWSNLAVRATGIS